MTEQFASSATRAQLLATRSIAELSFSLTRWQLTNGSIVRTSIWLSRSVAMISLITGSQMRVPYLSSSAITMGSLRRESGQPAVDILGRQSITLGGRSEAALQLELRSLLSFQYQTRIGFSGATPSSAWPLTKASASAISSELLPLPPLGTAAKETAGCSEADKAIAALLSV